MPEVDEIDFYEGLPDVEPLVEKPETDFYEGLPDDEPVNELAPLTRIWNGASLLSKDPREESAKAVQSFIDADAIKIPPDGTYRMQETIGVYAGKTGLFRKGRGQSSWPDIVASWGKSLMPMTGQSVGGLMQKFGEEEVKPRMESGTKHRQRQATSSG